MDLPVRCYECNRSIGQYLQLYLHYIRTNNIKIDPIFGKHDSGKSMSQLLDKLNIPVESYCCRKHFTARYSFHNALFGYDVDDIQPPPQFLSKK